MILNGNFRKILIFDYNIKILYNGAIMSNSDIAIKVENLSKYYRLGVINNGTLFRDIQSWAARKRGKEDPHAKIGSKYDPTEEGFWALKDVNFEIKKGDRVGIIGHNGAGKSTLLKILSQITAPTEGCLKINGKISSLLEVGTGFHSELTGRENIFMNGAILGMKHSEIDSKINEIIEFSEIGDYIDTPVKRYSSGMYVRLAFAVAAHLDSDILIADEVLAVGDAAFQKKALGKMNELSTGQGRTVLFVSHNMMAVKELCNKGFVFNKGKKIYEDDDIDSCINKYLTNMNETEVSLKTEIKTTNWSNDGSIYNEYLTLLTIGIYDKSDSLVTDALHYNEQYTIKATFKVSRKSAIPVEFGLRVMHNLDNIAFFSIPQAFYNPGNYTVSFSISPAQFLPGAYRLVVSSSTLNDAWIVNPDKNDVVICFQIESDDYYKTKFLGSLTQ